MTDAGVIGSRKQQKEWVALAASIRGRASVNVILLNRSRPQDPNTL